MAYTTAIFYVFIYLFLLKLVQWSILTFTIQAVFLWKCFWDEGKQVNYNKRNNNNNNNTVDS